MSSIRGKLTENLNRGYLIGALSFTITIRIGEKRVRNCGIVAEISTRLIALCRKGTIFGTWQHFDVANIINSEYCLQLAADTIVMHPFTSADFGLNMMFGIAMSADVEPQDIRFLNAGVTLINITQMRRSYNEFLEFVQRHTPGTVLRHKPPSDHWEVVFNFFNRHPLS